MTDTQKPLGCWECLKKRRVCDLGRPQCRKCHTRGLDCPGYDKKPLKWLQPGQTRSKGQRARDESNAGARQVALSMSPKLSCKSTALLEAFQYYNANVCPDMVATGNGLQSAFFIPLHAAAYMPTAIAESMICIALGHRILQCRDTFNDPNQLVLAKRLQSHRGSAIRALSEDLGRPDCHANDETLVSILTFLFSEIQQSISPTWRQHHDGAYKIIEMRGGMPRLILSHKEFRHLFQYFILTDVIGATTSPDIEITRARRQCELISILPILYGNGMSTSLPCPPELLAAVIRINDLRSRRRMIDEAEDEVPVAALEVLEDINSFSPGKWATEVRRYHRSGSIKGDSTVDEAVVPKRQASAWDWESVASTFQAAVAIYCISALLDQDEMAFGAQLGTEDIPILKMAYFATLLADLRRIASSQPDQLRKLVIWPLVIAGIERDAAQDDDRLFVIGELEWISRALGTAAPLVAKDFLTRLWKNAGDLQVNGEGRWDTLFDRPYVFAV
ncbi:Phomenoic acid biosynthesis cluster-specific transcriptional regulator-like protein [Cladobotryum mycophilum]|uniref:Phomenoic acid biosynthesis cluster-specific transcriptional regulator-like protein n=1 Tax=Cladobotryum mycophilum TaxID=491253 RepID=A0ABR0STA0_9HYPO